MHPIRVFVILSAALVVLGAFWTGVASAPVSGPPTVATATLNTAQESPAVKPETPRDASGSAAFVFNPARMEVGFAITYNGLSGPAQAAHFHRGASGAAGPVIQTICGGPDPAIISGGCPAGNSGTVTGVWKIPDNAVADWQAGQIYVNFHTALNPGGEIRGQVTGR